MDALKVVALSELRSHAFTHAFEEAMTPISTRQYSVSFTLRLSLS